MNRPPFMIAPVDATPAYVEHTVALTGLGVQGLLVGLCVSHKCSTTAEVVKLVEIVEHSTNPGGVQRFTRRGMEEWIAHRDGSGSDLRDVKVLDPRIFVEKNWTHFEDLGLKGELLAACWLIRSRMDEEAINITGELVE